MRRISRQTLLVLAAFLEAPSEWKYGYGISQHTGLKSGTLYPILMRLAERKFLETSWETAEVGKPPRHLYRLTSGGARFARETTSQHRIAGARRAILSGA